MGEKKVLVVFSSIVKKGQSWDEMYLEHYFYKVKNSLFATWLVLLITLRLATLLCAEKGEWERLFCFCPTAVSGMSETG